MAENVLMPEMSWTEVELALKERPIALLPVGNTEAHGPHLPVATDTLIAIEMARRTAIRLKQKGIPALIAPPVTFCVSELGAAFPGHREPAARHRGGARPRRVRCRSPSSSARWRSSTSTRSPPTSRR